ncbi:hypothetical protein WM40_15345 [Robbsia andropogonis]|uniref:Phage tail collar domain-containing protein n=1 Tax=Robbsia andropogonis TaxID=28092 RepID=A0A0F5JXX9_9BURK|nr:phage tail protein [Robbsia andropogonis]KKB62688.1 hypothetical protein WM40_15345 [Robbsia andropogonis]
MTRMLDQQLDAARAAFQAGNIPTEQDFHKLIEAIDGLSRPFATGMIVMFSGSKSDIPMGWQLCDGSIIGTTKKCTPDLTNRFVVGWSGDGRRPSGAARFDTTVGALRLPQQTVNVKAKFQTSAVALTKEQMPEHQHIDGIRWGQTHYKYTRRGGENIDSTDSIEYYTMFGFEKRTVGKPEPRSIWTQGSDIVGSSWWRDYRYGVLEPQSHLPDDFQGFGSKKNILATQVCHVKTEPVGNGAEHHHEYNGALDLELAEPLNVPMPFYALCFIMKIDE